MAAELSGQKGRVPEENLELALSGAERETEIDLVELLYHLLDHVKYIIAAALVGAVIAAIVTFFFTTPLYEATSKLYVVNSKDSAINLSDLQIGSYLTSDYQEVFKTWEVHEKVLRNLGLNYTYKQLEGLLKISNPSNTRILNITAQSADPKEATLLANEYARVAQGYIKEKMATDSPNILSEALTPVVPVSPNKSQNILLGFLAGAALSIGILVVMFVLDDKLKTAEDLRKFVGISTLGVVHEMDEPPEERAPIKQAEKRKKGEGKN